ncbi:hypothetical protein J7K43_08015 [Candidatus Calescamantes bacterium]|nr:hypothetical protein [Candidatus Calescamantes bacterium]
MEDKERLRRGFQIAVAASLFQVFLTFVFYIMYLQVKSPLLLTESFHAGIGLPIFVLLFLLFHQRYRERLEREEVEELAKREGRIFRDEETTLLVSRIRLRQTEKWIIPGITLLLAFLLIYTPLKIIVYFRGKSIFYEINPAIPLLLIGLTFLIFLFSRYILGMSKEKIWHDLRSVGTFLGVNALFSFLVAISLALKVFHLPKIEWFIFYLLNILLISVGFEYILNIILTFYRPPTAEKRLPFDSRIFYLLSTPEEVIPSFSEILDYQFGFHVTQTWFYQFIKRRIIPLLLLQLFLLYLLTSLVIVRPYERAFIEFLGKPIGGGKVFGPGLHLKLPWPIGKARVYDVERVKSIRAGVRGKEGERVLWTERHYEKEFNWIVASKEVITGSSRYTTVPVNFLTGVVWVYYCIDPEKLFNYAYIHSQPEKLLESLIYNQFTRMMMNVDFFEVMSIKRLSLAKILEKNIQEEADKHNLGIKIVLVSIGNLHPPVETASSFEKVVGAMERKEAYILDAESYKNRSITLARYNASRVKVEAESYRLVRSVESKARAEEFLKKLEAYQKNPRIFKYRYYLKALEKGLISPRKYIIISSERERNVTVLDLEKAPLPDILSLGLEGETKEIKK